MRFASASTEVRDLASAISELCDHTLAEMAGDRIDLVLAFVTSHFEEEAGELAQALQSRFAGAAVIGCSAESVLGSEAEHERVPALSIMLANLPGVELHPFYADPEDLAGPEAAHPWVERLRPAPGKGQPWFLLFADPFSVPINAVLKLLNQSFPGRPVLGGMVSGCEQPEQSVLILGDEVYRSGAVGLRVTGAIELRTVVSQGCRPLGERLVITKGQRNVIEQLGGRPALAQLRDLLRQLSGDDLALAQQAIFVGVAIDERKDQFKQGDYVIRQLMAGDPNSGAIMVGDEVRVGTSVQFHVRDRHSADEDLRALLRAAAGDDRPAGALLFTCNGRGRRMWSEPNHDVDAINEMAGPVPMAGFFAAGELGPVEGRNFIHGHTASLGLLYSVTNP